MSAKTIRLSVLFHLLVALGAALAGTAACGAALASLMVSQGLGPPAAWPFATAAVCAGSLLGGWVLGLLQKSRGLLWGGLLGLLYGPVLLCIRLISVSAPGLGLLLRLLLLLFFGGAGGYAGILCAAPRRRR